MCKVFFLFILIINLCSINAAAISARSAVLIDSKGGRVLYEHNAYEKLPMASTTKIMTGLLACESGKLAEKVRTSAFASGTEGSSLWLKPGEIQTLEDLTYGLMLKSGNDAAVSIAEYLGGNIDSFSLMMTKRAKDIGAVNTEFKNPHGLDAEGHYTTAYDLAIIAAEAMKNETFRKIVATKNYSVPIEGEDWDRALKNHNKLLWRYDGCNGIKTGYTKKCGRCLVSSAQRDGKELICVTLNAPDDWNDHEELLNYGFNNFNLKVIAKKDERITEIIYDKYNRKVGIICKDDVNVLVDDDDEIEVKTQIGKIKAPKKKGSPVGEMYVLCNGEKVLETELVTESDIKKLPFWKKIYLDIKNIFS